MNSPVDEEELDSTADLIDELGTYAYDPHAFVLWAFPWGEPGTELEKETGPNEWQTWLLCQVRDNLITLEDALLLSVTSGHGVGKSALVSWLIWWAYSTYPGTRGVVTANTENQLKTKTWVEISKWHRLFIARELFKCTATAIFPMDEKLEREWRIDIVPWSERNTEAFAGLHNAGKRLLIIFDEASAIPDVIWETTEGALTDENTEILWLVCGNPTRNVGRFRECFPGGKFGHRWISREVDSRTVPQTNKSQLNKWIEDYGIDSDFVRVRVLGKFPRNEENAFISRDAATEAAKRPPPLGNNQPLVLGVDVARYGSDLSVIYPRRGRDAQSIPPRVYSGLNTVQFCQRVIAAFNELGAVAVYVDGGGVGGGVVDQLMTLQLPVLEVQFGGKADNYSGLDAGVKYLNKRSEIWGEMREFLKTGSIVDEVPRTDISLVRELSEPLYNFDSKDRIVLESKELMRRRGVKSPDVADALAVTFAYPVPELNALGLVDNNAVVEADYNPYEDM